MSKPTISIPWPMQISRPRGHSVRGQQSRNRTFRFDDDEFELIEEAAKRCGIDRSALVRWVMLSASNEIVKLTNHKKS